MESILDYLSALVGNNNREWFHAHKDGYQKANADFEYLLDRLILVIAEFDGSIVHTAPKNLTFKLVRDTRFSHDKSPYNPTFRAHISAAGKQPVPVGYYISLAPQNRSFLGGGLFASMFKDATAMVRDYLAENGGELDAIISDENFAKLFTVKGESLKKVPSGYDANHRQAEYLKHKSWYLEYPVPDTLLKDTDEFIKQAGEVFQRMKPFNDFLNEALKGFKMPAR